MKYLRAAMLLLTAIALSVPANVALAQQMSDELKVRSSGVKSVRSMVMQYVEKKSQAMKVRTGVELNTAQKMEMVDFIISKIEAHGAFNFVH